MLIVSSYILLLCPCSIAVPPYLRAPSSLRVNSFLQVMYHLPRLDHPPHIVYLIVCPRWLDSVVDGLSGIINATGDYPFAVSFDPCISRTLPNEHQPSVVTFDTSISSTQPNL